MMNLDLLRNWIRAEIEFAMACHEVDDSGYRQSGRSEEREADKLFNLLKEGEKNEKKQETQKDGY